MIHYLLNQVKDFRFEHKFIAEGVMEDQVEAMIKFHPALFRELYSERQVNSLYLDRYDLKNYHDNVDGLSERSKVRIRWYGETFGLIKKPTLEFKVKKNFYVGKILFPMMSFRLDSKFSMKVLRNTFQKSSLPGKISFYLSGLNYSTLHSYSRKYFIDASKRYRLTLDKNIRACKLASYENSFLDEFDQREPLILELKYATEHSDTADAITNYFPFRMTKNSKYVQGIQRLYG